MINIPMLGDFMSYIKPKLYDDLIDRINYYYTPIILLFFTFAVMGKQYIGTPIQCFIPAEFKGGWEQYTEDYCFIQNTYYVPLHQDIPNDIQKREEKEIGYYQWIPVVLAIQAILFYLPFFFWKGFCWQSGINVESILKKAQDATGTSSSSREGELRELAKYMEENLGTYDGGRITRFGCIRVSGRRGGLGSFICGIYLLMKVFFAVNVVSQFFLLNAFLGTEYRFWGFEIMMDLYNGREWSESGHFPRVTLCDFAVRRLGNLQRFSVQCVLMMNMFNEKIYLFLWFWFFFVACCTFINLLYWLLSMIFPIQRKHTIVRYLRVGKGFDNRDLRQIRGTVDKFTEQWLKPDGVLLLRFIGSHNGEMISTELTRYIWDDFVANQREIHSIRAEAASNSTKSSQEDDGFAEDIYDPVKGKEASGVGLLGVDGHSHGLLPSAPPHGYPGPPAVMPKPKLANV